VAIHAALVRCDRQGRAVLVNPQVRVDLSHGDLAGQNRGSYMVTLHLPADVTIGVGALGELAFKAGWYVYCGSAQRNLAQRMARHLRQGAKPQGAGQPTTGGRRAKKTHWHLDYLTPYADAMKALPVASYRNLECDFARTLAGLGGEPIPRFGSSDCTCPTHLYRFADPPMQSRPFVDALLRSRHIEGLVRE
jgi:sugar fermentation stimulation protein A